MCPLPVRNRLSINPSVESSNTSRRSRPKNVSSDRTGISSSGSTRIKSFAKITPCTCPRSPWYTGNRECPLWKTAFIVSKSRTSFNSSINTRGSGVITSTTFFSQNSSALPRIRVSSRVNFSTPPPWPPPLPDAVASFMFIVDWFKSSSRSTPPLVGAVPWIVTSDLSCFRVYRSSSSPPSILFSTAAVGHATGHVTIMSTYTNGIV
mmetsp:Transcript_10170/g.21312  ORF Transcript_10170/g.21312 Transcript_10170/m.21312 type:complete len:207 (-) Transcript_10170:573-1193(-)